MKQQRRSERRQRHGYGRASNSWHEIRQQPHNQARPADLASHAS
jgi:hypothetical protein